MKMPLVSTAATVQFLFKQEEKRFKKPKSNRAFSLRKIFVNKKRYEKQCHKLRK